MPCTLHNNIFVYHYAPNIVFTTVVVTRLYRCVEAYQTPLTQHEGLIAIVNKFHAHTHAHSYTMFIRLYNLLLKCIM